MKNIRYGVQCLIGAIEDVCRWELLPPTASKEVYTTGTVEWLEDKATGEAFGLHSNYIDHSYPCNWMTKEECVEVANALKKTIDTLVDIEQDKYAREAMQLWETE